MSDPATGADLLVRALEDAGVEAVFGLPGTQTVGLFEALRRSRLRTVLTTSETSAAFMAGGWARLRGAPGVVITIPGPGFAWALPGIAEASLDSVPLLHLSGAAPQTLGRRYRQQEIDQVGIARALTRAQLLVTQPEEIRGAVHEALSRAERGEPGPVLLEVAPELLAMPAVPAVPAPAPVAAAGPDLSALHARVRAARRPVLFAGQAAAASGKLTELAEHLGAPVVTTASGRGGIPEDHRLAMGFDGLCSDPAVLNQLFQAADLLLVLGAKLGHNGTCGYRLQFPARTLIHIDTGHDVLGANYPASLSIQDDIGHVLTSLLREPPEQSQWTAEELGQWRRRLRQPAAPGPEPRLAGRAPVDFFTAFRRALPRDAVLVLDSGLHQILARRYYEVLAPQGLLLPSDLQSMGFCLPTAIGARLAAPGRPVVALTGDGGFAMNGLELLTAVREGLDLLVVVMVDGYLGQIRNHQMTEFGAGHAVRLQNPDFELLAAAVGARYARVEDALEPVLLQALASGGVTLIEVPVGDGVALVRRAVAARVRQLVRRTVGPRAVGWLKRLLGRH